MELVKTNGRNKRDVARIHATPPKLIYFDISDFVYFIGHHDNLTGIQRVQAEIIAALPELAGVEYHFISFSHKHNAFVGVSRGFLQSVIHDLTLQPTVRTIAFDKEAARGGVLSDGISKTIATVPLHDRSIICLLGAAWVNQNYSLHIQNFRRKYRTRFIGLLHDLIPIYAKETCDQGTAQVFEKFLSQFLTYTDAVLTVSQSTKNDLVRYINENEIEFSGSITVTKNGGGIVSKPDDDVSEQLYAEAEDYVLFVSTIEGRKNHLLAFRALEKILARRGDAPNLVCVGRVGWRAEGFLNACYETNFLEGRIQILQDVSDSELERLYQGSRFTIYPSMYEGWGLPVGESLERGKVVICSDSSSLPEVGGEHAVYFRSGSADDLADAIETHFYDPHILESALSKAREYEPHSWQEVAKTVVAACNDAFTRPMNSLYGKIELAREYPVMQLPTLPQSLNGDELANVVRRSRTRLLSEGSFAEADFRAGLSARVGGWCQPEEPGCWVSMDGGELIYELVNDVDEAMLYIAYNLAPVLTKLNLVVRASGGYTRNLEVTKQSGLITIPSLKRTATAHGAFFSAGFSFNLDESQRKSVMELDGRFPVLMIRSFINVEKNDFASRLSILERLNT